MKDLTKRTIEEVLEANQNVPMTFFDANEAAAIAKLLYNVYFVYPTEGFIELLVDSEITKTWYMFADNDQHRTGLHHLAIYLEQWKSEQLTNLKLDYGDLYYGAAMPLALPWGSCWLTEQKLLNDTTTQDLVRFYDTNCISLYLDQHQPADHIGLFLSVISQLLELIAANPDDKEPRNVLTVLLSKHLLTWSDEFMQASIYHAKTDFYIGMAYLLKDLLNAISKELGIFATVNLKGIE
jgi:TorA maturation chaperone TorD